MSAYGAAHPQEPLLPFLPAACQGAESEQELGLGCPRLWLHWGWWRTDGLIAGMEAAKGTPRAGICQLPLSQGHQALHTCGCTCFGWGGGLGLWPWQAVAAPLTETTLSPCPLLSLLIRLPGVAQGRRLQLVPGSHWRSS